MLRLSQALKPIKNFRLWIQYRVLILVLIFPVFNIDFVSKYSIHLIPLAIIFFVLYHFFKCI